MNIRLAVSALALVALAACGSTDSEPGATDAPTSSSPTSEATPTADPSASAAPSAAADLVGTWDDPEAQWTVRFAADGTYVMDYQGVKDFSSGRYTLEGGTVRLTNDEGTDEGRVEGSSLVFKLGTLTRG